MKKLINIFLISIVLANLLNGQNQSNFTLQFGLNHNEFAYNNDFTSPEFTVAVSEKPNLGFSVGWSEELFLSECHSFLYGLSHVRINSHKKLEEGLWDALFFKENNSELIHINPSYLDRLQYDLIEIPLSWRYYITKEKNFRPFFGLGLNASFNWRKRERWSSLGVRQTSAIYTSAKQLAQFEASSFEIQYFRSAFFFDLGGTFKLSDRHRLVVYTQSNVLEHRSPQRSILPDLLPAFRSSSLTYFSQIAIRVGLQRYF